MECSRAIPKRQEEPATGGKMSKGNDFKVCA